MKIYASERLLKAKIEPKVMNAKTACEVMEVFFAATWFNPHIWICNNKDGCQIDIFGAMRDSIKAMLFERAEREFASDQLKDVVAVCAPRDTWFPTFWFPAELAQYLVDLYGEDKIGFVNCDEYCDMRSENEKRTGWATLDDALGHSRDNYEIIQL